VFSPSGEPRQRDLCRVPHAWRPRICGVVVYENLAQSNAQINIQCFRSLATVTAALQEHAHAIAATLREKGAKVEYEAITERFLDFVQTDLGQETAAKSGDAMSQRKHKIPRERSLVRSAG